MAARKKKPFVIDFHGHIVIPKIFKQTQKFSLHARIGLGKQTSLGGSARSEETMVRMTDAKEKLKDMDKMGVDMMVISPSLIHHNTESLTPARALKIVKVVNEEVAQAVNDNPDRFCGIGIVPFHEPKLAARELDRQVNKLGLKGVTIPTTVKGLELGDKYFWPFWRKAEKLDVPVFIHPAGNADERLRKFGLAFTVGQPYEEALAISSLVYEGVMDRFPGLKIVVAHGGGYLPYYAGRQDNAYREGRDGGMLKGDFSSYLKKFYYETAIFNPDMLDFLATKTSPKHILMGTDYPFGEKSPVPFVRAAKTLSTAAQNGILARNAAALLKLNL